MYIFFSSISLLLTLDGVSHYFSPKRSQIAEELIVVINMSFGRTEQAQLLLIQYLWGHNYPSV